VGGLLNTLLGPEETGLPSIHPCICGGLRAGAGAVVGGGGLFSLVLRALRRRLLCWGGWSGCCLFFENYTVDASIFISLLVILNRF
jgi:hypothetical protein